MAGSVVNGARGRGIQKNEKSFWIFCIFLQIEAYPPLRVGRIEGAIDVCARAHVHLSLRSRRG